MYLGVTAALTRNLQISLANQTHFAEVGLACETQGRKRTATSSSFFSHKKKKNNNINHNSRIISSVVGSLIAQGTPTFSSLRSCGAGAGTIRMWTASSASNRRCSRRVLLAATLGIFVILLFLWIWIRRPVGTPSGSNYKTPQARRPLQPARLRSNRPKLNRFKPESTNRNQQARRPLQPARLRSNRRKMNRFKPESTTRNQPDPSNTNYMYSKLNITYAEKVEFETNSSGVFISVRTTVKFHKSRLLLLLHTWLQTVDPKQVDSVKSKSNLNYKDLAELLFCRSRLLLIL